MKKPRDHRAGSNQEIEEMRGVASKLLPSTHRPTRTTPIQRSAWKSHSRKFAVTSQGTGR
jgi:hypothetical protein